MNWLQIIQARFLAVFKKRTLDAEMDEEMRSHVEMRTQANMNAGMNPDEARYAARREFGWRESIKETCREQRGVSWIEDFLRDLRYASRQLRKNPSFTAVAVLSLGLGIGANTAIFSLVNAILLRSLPLPNPHELRVLKWSGTHPNVNFSGGWSQDEMGRATANAFSYPAFSSLRKELRNQAEIIGNFRLANMALRGGQAPFVGQGSMVSDNYFSGFGIRAELGRVLSVEDNLAGAAPVAVVSHHLWERELGGGPEAIGKSLLVNGKTFTVVGVLPTDFPGITPAKPPDFYVPMSARHLLDLSWSETAPDQWWVQIMARLKPGITDAGFKSLADVVFARGASSAMKSPTMVIENGSLGPSSDPESYRKPLLILLIVVGIVLLVACANLAGLMFARGAARRHELAVCAAIGANKWRLMLQSLSESLLLAASGGALGILLAFWGRDTLSRLLAGQADGLHYDMSLDARVLGFTTATVIVTALLSGLLPSIWSARVSPLSSLKERSGSGLQRPRMGRFLVTAQFALSALLLVGALLYVRTLHNLVRIQPGFDAANLVLFQLDPESAGYDGAHRSRFYDQAQQVLSAIPGVQSVALTQSKLLGHSWTGGSFFTLPGFPTEGDSSPKAYRLTINETFFDTMRIPIVQGRSLQASDIEGRTKVVVVNRKFVEKYFPNQIPIGRILTLKERKDVWQIVGVCADAKYADIKEDVPPLVYFSFRQDPEGNSYFALRTSQAPGVIVKEARNAIASVDPNIPLFDITTQTQVLDEGISQERLFAVLCGALAGLAVLLSCIGVYGLTAYNVARRTGEIGIRMALGATWNNIAGNILREALFLGAMGVAIGIPTALALSRLIKSQLFGVASNDPTTLILAVVTLLIVALLAAWIPARRAANVEPMAALRNE